MRPFVLILLAALSTAIAQAANVFRPDRFVQAPVVHAGRYHILSSGQTSVVLDGSKGMKIAAIGQRMDQAGKGNPFSKRIEQASLEVELDDNGKVILLTQANDPASRLQVISQGPTHVAARVFFSICSADGKPFGTGTLDFYIYPNRVHLVPSIYIDHLNHSTRIARAGFVVSLTEPRTRLEIMGKEITATGKSYFERFGDPQAGFEMTAEQASGEALKIGWLRNRYPEFLYLREVDQNPERDELYEKWPLWISQRGAPLAWKIGEQSGLEVKMEKARPASLSFLWTRQDKLTIPKGGYQIFNAALAIFLGGTKTEAGELWQNFAYPLKPAVEKGDLRFYNEIEGIYEVDSQGRDAALTFDCSKEKASRLFMVRFWNLKGKGAWAVRADRKDVPFGLMNEGDLVEDPMVFISKGATGPARWASVGLNVPKGKKTHLSLERRPGCQLTYQMYSDLETYEAWSDQCLDQPLFRLHLKELAIYQATLPEGRDYAFFKLPLYWLKNGVNPSTFMSHLRGFEILGNGPEEILFAVRSVNLQETGLSSYLCLVPYEPTRLTIEIMAEFTPLDDGERWTSLEYCDLYPFEDVYRRNFHYQDVIFLTREGVFDRVGTGAWDMMFRPVDEPHRLDYYSEYVKRSGPGANVPHPQDGSVWFLGNNGERGNILFRRGDWQASPGARPVFTLCNAWVDIHNFITDRRDKSAGEKISFTVELFPGPVPSLQNLNAMYERDVGRRKAARIKAVRYSPRGEIIGFVAEK